MNDLQMIYYNSKRALQITNCIIGNLTHIFWKIGMVWVFSVCDSFVTIFGL